MRKAILTAGCCVLLFGCDKKTDAQIIDEAKEAVKNELMQKYKPGDCDRWKILESSGYAKKGSAVINCDTNFNPSLGLEFTDVKVFQHEKFNTVCGIVSGHTDISRIGGRFVYTDGDSKHVFIKKSKEPVLLTDKSDSTRSLLKMLDKQLEIESRLCR